MEYRILGPFEVVRAGVALPLGGPRQQAVLVTLLLHAGETLTADRIIEEVWGAAAPRDAVNTLHGYVFHLRQALEPERPKGTPAQVLVSDRSGYRLDASPESIDAATFERLADHGRRLLSAGDPEQAAARLAEALLVWRGDPLPGFEDLDAARADVRRLEERRLQAMEDRMEALLGAGDSDGALTELDRVIADHPWHERLWELRMLGLYRAGRQADALAAFAEVRGLMREELGLDPGPALTRMETRILDHDPSLEPTPTVERTPPIPGRIPHPATSFVGRHDDVNRLLQMLDSARLVTVIGPGGVGKTRLALEAMHRAEPALETAFVDLADVARDEMVIGAVATALGAGEEGGSAGVEAIRRVIGDRILVVVLDNCEHVIAPAAGVASDLLAACAGVRIVATSREALAIDGEQLLALAPMSTPPHDFRGATAAARLWPAVELFASRALAGRRDLDLDAEMDSVITICRALDGIPLALELAAARLRSMPLRDLADRIEDRFRVLTGGSRTRVSRQQTLEATVAWSYALLDDLERLVFSRLSVFVGGFDLEAAEAVTSAAPVERSDVIDLVGQLVDKSLVVLDAGSGRYRMLETIRAYAAARLVDECGASDQTRSRHARWCAEVMTAHAPGLRGGGHPDTIEAIERDAANFRAALDWSFTADQPDLAVTLAADLGSWWELRGLLTEGRGQLERALATGAGSDIDRYRLMLAIGFVARRQGDQAAALHHSESALAGFRQCDDPAHLAHALGRVAWVALGAGDADRAISLANEGLELAHQLGDDSVAPWMHLGLGHAAHAKGELEAATEALILARDGFQAIDNGPGLGRALFHLALLALERGDLEAAGTAASDSVAVMHEGHDLNGTLMGIEVVARVASSTGDHPTAVRLCAATARWRQQSGAHDHGGLDDLDEITTRAITELSPADLDAAAAAGASLTLDDAVLFVAEHRSADPSVHH